MISLLDSYLTGNPRVDIRLILCDQQACDAFIRGQRLRKNCNLTLFNSDLGKDMNLSEPKNIRRSKDSFRRSKSTLSSQSDDDTNIHTFKKPRPTMAICFEDPNGEDLYND